MSALSALEALRRELRDVKRSLPPVRIDDTARWDKYRYDRVAFALDLLGGGLPSGHVSFTDIEREYLQTAALEVILLWARQCGKTTNTAILLCHGAIFDPPPRLSLVTSATERQAKIVQRRTQRFLLALNRKERWRKVRDVEVPYDLLDENSQLVKRSVMALEMANGNEVVSVPASADTIRGYSPNRIVMDEAAYTPEDVYTAVRPMRAETQAQLLVLSSAGFTQGWFYDWWNNEEDTEVLRLEMKATENPRITAKFLERERLALKPWPGAYEREYENVFMAPKGAIFTPEMIQDMFSPAIKTVSWNDRGDRNGHQVETVSWGATRNGKH